MNSKSVDERGGDLPNLKRSESGSSCRWVTSPTEDSVPQIEAAVLTRLETSITDGRSLRSLCQQSSSSFQTLSERPSSRAFVGFEGVPPPKTLNTTSGPGSLPNGSVPVSTYVGGINMRVHQVSCDAYLVYHHGYCVHVGLLRRYALVQPKSRWDKELRSHERSGPSACFRIRRRHPEAWVVYDGHEPEVRETCRDGVLIRD